MITRKRSLSPKVFAILHRVSLLRMSALMESVRQKRLIHWKRLLLNVRRCCSNTEILPQVTLPPPLPLVMMLICVHWICFSNERIIFTGKTPHGEKLQKIIISNCPPFSVVAIIFPLQPWTTSIRLIPSSIISLIREIPIQQSIESLPSFPRCSPRQ